MYYQNYEKIRDEQKLTDYKVAGLAKVSRSVISAWKTGKNTPSTTNMNKIAKALGVSIATIMRD